MIIDANTRIYIAVGATDMRKAINGLSALVGGTLQLDALSGHLFVFSNRARNIIKILYWDKTGFCLWQKRLERGRFRWPESREEVLTIGRQELGWLLSGLEIYQAKAHKTLTFSKLY